MLDAAAILQLELAGIKLIVVGLVLVLIFTASTTTLIYAAIALVIAIASFYWRMFPMIRTADDRGQITPQGRSRTLAWMVAFLEFSLILSIILEAS